MKLNKKILLLLLSIMCLVNPLLLAEIGYTSLIRKKREFRKKIKSIQNIILKNKKKKKHSLGKLNEIFVQINFKNNILKIIDKQMKLANDNLKSKVVEIKALNMKLRKYISEYSELIYEEMKAMNSLSKVLFIFSSKSFHEIFLRKKYLDQINRVRKIFLYKIKKTKDLLEIEKKNTKKKRDDLHKLSLQYKKEQYELSRIKLQQQETVINLNKQTKKLKRDLKIQMRSANKINELLKKTIAKTPKEQDKYYNSSTNDTIILRRSFIKNKGKLPWPVKKGFISKKFGIRRHPILANVKVENLGIDIRTDANAEAFAIFDGIVEIVAFVPYFQQLVIIKHKGYYTVYSKLKNVHVKVGQYVKALTPIGIIFTNKEGFTELQFQICDKNGIKLNPEKWIK